MAALCRQDPVLGSLAPVQQRKSLQALHG